MSERARLLWIRVGAACLWFTLAAGAVAIISPDKDAAAFGVALTAFVGIFSVVRPFRGAHIAVAAFGAVVFSLVQGVRHAAPGADPNAPYLQAAAVGSYGLVISAMISNFIRRSLLAYDEQFAALERLVEEIETVEPTTGALKRAHGERLLAAELVRAGRYAGNLALIMLSPEDWPEVINARGEAAAGELLIEVAGEYLRQVRGPDHIIHLDGPDFLALLPETGLNGAQIVAERLCDFASARMGTAVHAGIAVFPDDAVTSSDLMLEAERATSFAKVAQITVASRSLLT